MRSITADDFFELDRLFAKGEINFIFKMTLSFAVIGSIAYTTRKFINNVAA